MTSFAYRLGRGTHTAVNVVAAGTVVAAAGTVYGVKKAGSATGQFGREFAAGYQSTGGVADTLARWMNKPVGAEAQPKRRMWDVNGNVIDV